MDHKIFNISSNNKTNLAIIITGDGKDVFSNLR